MEYLCEQFESPFSRLVQATRKVEQLCGEEGMHLSQASSIAYDHKIELTDLLNHLGLLGYKVDGAKTYLIRKRG